MALKLTVESFLQVVRQSGLVEKDQLQKLIQKFAERGVDLNKSQAIAEALVKDDIITRWQAEKLLAGKHKGFFLGKYRLLDLLGKGGMSSVYLAEHTLMKRRCAIKVLPSKRVNDSSYLARFHREAQAVASVDHPNIVRAYDVDCAMDRDSEIHFLVMEYVNGQSLQELIIRSGPADYADAVEYIRQAADGLENAHRAGLVHRDIKPANLLIDTVGTIKLLDMGLARFFDDQAENPLTVAHDEKVLGTADYLAPEQALDSHSVDTRADIYSLGCSLYFLLTGKPPYTEGTLTQRLMWHQTKSFPPLTDSRIDCPESLSVLLAKMVEKKPEDRFQTAADVAEACRQWLTDNAGPDWKQRHTSSIRSATASGRMTAPSRDLQSDPAILRGTSHVMGSTLIPKDVEDSKATKISQAATVAESPPVAAPVATPIAAPVAAPIAAPVAAPVAQAVAAMPVARPVVPVAMPVAQPIVATPVAQPVNPFVPVAAPIAPPVTAAEPSEPAFDFNFAETAATEATVVAPTVAEQEPVQEGEVFSLFGNDEPAPEPVAESPFAAAVESAATEVSLPETVVIESPVAEPAPDFTAPDFTVTDSTATDFAGTSFDSSSFNNATAPKSVEPVAQKAAAPKVAAGKSPVALYGAIAAVVVLLAGGGYWWSTRGAGETDPSVAKTAKATKKGSKSGTTTGGPKKSDAHEVTLSVGAGGDFKSIGRAVYSVIEGKAEHEAAANGKPLRFVISVKPGQTYEESLAFDESFPGEVLLTSDTPGKNFTLTSPSLTEPAITIKNRSGVTIENVTIDLVAIPQKEKGIVISGNVERCRIRNCVLSDVGKSGIELSGAVGGEGADGIVLDAISFQKCSPVSSSIQITKPSDGKATQRVTVQRCRFFGSMAASVFVNGPVEGLTIRNCGSSGGISGVRVGEGVVAKKVVVDHCSFRRMSDAGLLFDGMPGDGTSDLTWTNCLFSENAKAELLVAKGYDANKFNAVMSTDKPVENNWTDRKTGKPTNGERDLLGSGGQRVATIQFDSTSLGAELFLVAKAGEPYKSAGIKAK